MAADKIKNLKDEELSLSDKIEERFDSIDSDLAEIKRNKVDISSLETQVKNMPDVVWENLDKKLDERFERLREEDKAEGRISPNECLEKVTEIASIFDKRHENVVGVVKLIAGYLKKIDNYIREEKTTAQQTEQTLSQSNAVEGANISDLSFPSIPPKDGKWGKLIWKVICYIVKRIKLIPFIKQYLFVCSWLLTILSWSAIIVICHFNASDKAELENIAQLSIDRYYIIYKLSHIDDKWAEQAKTVQRLYTDPTINKSKIDSLKNRADKVYKNALKEDSIKASNPPQKTP
jgi:hypothetical protein